MFIILLIVIVNLLLGFLVLSQNAKSMVNRTFFIMVVSMVLWMVSSFLTDNALVEYRLVWAKLAFVFPVVVTSSFALFAQSFSFKSTLESGSAKYIITTGLIGVVLSITDLVVGGIVTSDRSTAINPGLLYSVYIIIVLFLTLNGVWHLVMNTKKRSYSNRPKLY